MIERSREASSRTVKSGAIRLRATDQALESLLELQATVPGTGNSTIVVTDSFAFWLGRHKRESVLGLDAACVVCLA